jgi:hypothetical protein
VVAQGRGALRRPVPKGYEKLSQIWRDSRCSVSRESGGRDSVTQGGMGPSHSVSESLDPDKPAGVENKDRRPLGVWIFRGRSRFDGRADDVDGAFGTFVIYT